METFQPFINLLVVLTVLSIVAERITNVLKLRNADLRLRPLDEAAKRDRELKISLRSVLVGIGVALAVKANFFELVANMQDPWSTFGWVVVDRHTWVQSGATRSFGPMLYTFAGCALTGFALGFGSKFWHDILGTIYEYRDGVRSRNQLVGADPQPDE